MIVTSAVTEKVFKSWKPSQQNKYLKEHPNSKFWNFKQKNKSKNSIKTKNKEGMLKKLQEKTKKGESLYNNKEAKYVINKLEKDIKQKDKIPSTKYSSQLQPFNLFEKSTGIDSTKIGMTLSKLDTILNNLKHKAIFDKSKETIKSIKDFQKQIDSINKKVDKLLISFKGKKINLSKLNDKERFLIERLKEYSDDLKEYKSNLKKTKNPEYKKAQKLGIEYRKLSDEYRSAISEWLRSKKRDEKSEETKKLGAKVGELKIKVNKVGEISRKYEEENKDKLPAGVPIKPLFGIHKGQIPQYKSEEDKKRDDEIRKSTYTRVNRYKK
jgi:hypothetical protein